MDPLAIFRGWLETLSTGSLFAFLVRVTLLCAAGHVALRLLRRAPAAVRHLVATATLAALVLVPVLFALPAAWPAWRIPVPAARVSAGRVAGDVGDAWQRGGRAAGATAPARSESPSRATDRRSPLTAILMPVRAAVARAAAPLATPRLGAVLALLALGGSEALLLWFAFNACCAGWLARRARTVDQPELLAEMAAARGQLGLRRDVAVRVSDRLAVPVVVGLVRPCLVLPLAALDWPAARRQAVLVHELAHVARYDGAAQCIARLATSLYWFHPLAWTLARIARDECERAADDSVLRGGVRASDYADHLLAVARDAMRAPLPRAALAFARPSSLESRLLAILQPDARREPVSRAAAAWTAVALAAVVLPLTSLRVVAAPQASPRHEAAPAAESRTDFVEITSQQTRTRTATLTSGAQPVVTLAESEPSLGALDSRTGKQWYDLGHERYDAQRYTSSAEAYENAARRGHRVDVAWYNSACSWSLAGRRDAALGALLHALDAGFGDLDAVQTDDDLAAIRSDARYQLLLDRALRSDQAVEQRESARADFDALRASGERDADAWHDAGMALLRSGEADRAAQAFAAEVALDSSASGLYNIACAQARGHHTADALKTLEHAVLVGYGDAKQIGSDADLASLANEPAFDRIQRLADDLTLFSHGRGDDDTPAWRADLPRFERITREYPGVGRGWFNLGYATLRVDDLAGSARAFGRALELGYRPGTTSYNLACVAARQRDADGAFRWLARAEQAGMDVGGPIRNDQDLASLRSDPRYHRIIERWDAEQAVAKAEKAAKRDKEKGKDKD